MSKVVYAIGDVHGYGYLLHRLQQEIIADSFERGYEDRTIVYLGDYVDRGLQSRQAIQHLIDAPLAQMGFTEVHLRGNHEALMLDFMEQPNDDLVTWLSNGGLECATSYGVAMNNPRNPSVGDIIDVSVRLNVTVPEDHKSFLKGLRFYHVETIGDVKYLFVHAGIRPGVALEDQKPVEMIWIRDKFLNSQVDHGYIVVHGHTPKEYPEVLPNRINVDTGVFFTGKLTAVVLDGSPRPRFLTAE